MALASNNSFFQKWLTRIKTDLKIQFNPDRGGENNTDQGEGKKPLSLRIAIVLNLLNYPLFWSGILLFCWLLLEYLGRPFLPPALLFKIHSYSEPIVSVFGPAAVGYWTNWLAIKMLFHPQRKNAVWLGLVHARREEIIASLVTGIQTSLISPEIIRRYLDEHDILKVLTARLAQILDNVVNDQEFRLDLREYLFNLLTKIVTNPRIRGQIEEYLDTVIRDWTGESLSGKMLEWTKQLWGTAVRNQILAFWTEVPQHVDELLPPIIAYLETIPAKLNAEDNSLEPLVTELITDGLRSMDFEGIIRGQLGKLDAFALEKLLTSDITEELVFIQTSGGIFGFLVGLAILYPLLRPVFVLGGLLLWGVYHWTVEKK